MSKPRLFMIGLAIGWLAACAGGQSTATPLPPEVARPVQPTPVYAGEASFRLNAPAAPVMATPRQSSTESALTPSNHDELARTALTFDQFAPPPTALGIATGGAILLDQPDGQVIAQLPVGEIVTVTGMASDGRFVAIYTNALTVGWIASGQLTLYGADDLVVTEQAFAPGPIATLMAEAMEPVQVLDQLLATPAP